MKLTVAERITLQGILPKNGDFVTLKVLRKLKETLSFSEEEIAKLQFMYECKCPKCGQTMNSPAPVTCGICDIVMQPTGRLVWSVDKEPNKDVHMGKKAEDICKEALTKLNNEKKLEDIHFSLYEKFLGEQEEMND